MFRSRPHALLIAAGACAALLLSGLSAHAQQAEPGYDSSAQVYDNSDQAPGRVARIAYISGQVQFAPAGEDSWGSIEVNRPMVIGDRLLTGEDGRAVLELGDASVRLDQDSAFDFLNLEQDNVQIELSQGTVNLAVHRMDQGANFEIDTPTVAFVASTPGNYRVDNDPDGTGSIVTVFQGSGVVYGENGSSRQVAAGQSYRFDDSTLASVEVNGLPEPDDFDRFCEARDQRYEQYAQQSQQYVPPEMIGGQDLEQYGQWSSTPDYGTVWYPNTVPSGWAPYRYGHWAWIEPWGWTWVDNQPWGFAPFHYGRWVYVRSRWGWMPGPVNVRPVYAPALVGFLGGSGVSLSVNIGNGPVGWFPLGPRDVYVPWFHASRGYFTNVNITNIRRVYVNRTIINNRYGDYRSGRRWSHGRHDYPYRHLPGAVTAVDRNIFTGARPVHPAVLKLDRNRLARFEVANRPGVNPGRASLGVRNPTHRPGFAHGREPFSRPVVARHRPPPRPVSFATREKVIATQHGQPLTPVQLRNLQQHRTTTHPDRRRNVKLATAGNAGHAPPRPAEPGAVARAPVHSRVPPRPAEPSARPGSGPTRPPFKNTVRPIQVPARPIASRPASKTPPRPNELPSARFAHPERRAGQLPHVPVIRPAGNEPAHRTGPERRLPVVRPVQSAPRAIAQRNEPASRPPVRTAPQPPRAPTLQQQRRVDDQRQQVQQQAQQRAAREQQAQQQQAQRARQQQAQQQAQRARQQQMQQQAFRAREQQQARQVQMRREPQVRQQPQRARPEPRNAPRRAPPPPRSSKQHDNNRREHRQ